MCEFLREIAKVDNWDYILDGTSIIGLKKLHETITLEPGCQFELSLEPQQYIRDLKKRVEEINKALISFFSDGVNVALFDTNKLASMALKYPSLCSSPAVVWKIHVGKSEMWYENYLETVKNATFVNDLTIYEINKS